MGPESSTGAIPKDAREAARATEAHLDRGEPLLAFNEAQAALARWPTHARLRQLQALALARSGDTARANRILAGLLAEGMDDAETLGLLARTHKDLALSDVPATARKRHLEAAFALYERAWREARARKADADAWYTGINAATVAVLLGDIEAARSLAAEVRKLCARADTGGEDDAARYWRTATLGEAALVLGDVQAAVGHYRDAARLARGHCGDLSTTRRQARLLGAHLPDAGAALDALAIPPVLAFTGHMVDAEERSAPRFPARIVPAVRSAIAERLLEISPVAVYSSAACGSDLICLELAQEQGAETHIVLPFPADEFRAVSVDFAGGDWSKRFEWALRAARSVTVASPHRASGSAATFEYANLILTGMARLRAQVLDTELRGLAVLDPSSAGAAGGSSSLVDLWAQQGIASDRIDLREFGDVPRTGSGYVPERDRGTSPNSMRHELRALLFADAVGYSQMSEDQIPLYVSEFLGAVAALNERTRHRCEHVEVAGDGFYMVFADAGDAGRYALELRELASGRDWTGQGLPASFNLRIALHAGPVHCGRDPVTGGPMFTGPHASRAARIEPITPPGQVYASSAFAAVAAAQGVAGLALAYVGRIPLAKGYGTLGLYHVRGG